MNNAWMSFELDTSSGLVQRVYKCDQPGNASWPRIRQEASVFLLYLDVASQVPEYAQI
jgi:hypothetical protein